MGKAGDDRYRFHSEILGDLNLPLAKIRSIECQSKTNSVKLVTPDGDTLQAHFLLSEIRVSPVDQATPMLPGLVVLWSAEGNGNDASGGNNATLTHGETLTFAGLLDGAAIYNCALSAEEIKANAVN